MPSSKTHPHADMPTDEMLGKLIDSLHPAHRRLYLDAHRLVLESVPGVTFSVDRVDGAIGYAARQFGYDGWGMAALTPYSEWVSLGFLKGARLPDPDGLLQGTGALVRHVKLTSPEELASKREPIRRLIEAAVFVNEG